MAKTIKTDTDKKASKDTYFIMKRALKSKNINVSADNFPSDQFIIRNLPESIRKTEGAARPIKTALVAATVGVISVLAGIVAPLAMFAFGAISTMTLSIAGSIGIIATIGSIFKTKNEIPKIKYHAPDIGKYLMAKHIVEKAKHIKKTWKENKKERKKSQPDLNNDNNPQKPKLNKTSSTLLNTIKVKEAWDKTVTDESKEKIKQGLSSAKDKAIDTAEETVKNAKKKLGGMFRKFKRGK